MPDAEKTVEEAIDTVAAESEAGLSGVKEALAKAQTAMDSASSTMQSAYGKARERSREAAEKARESLADAKKHLAVARERMGELAVTGREKADALYASSKEQYEVLSAKSRDLYGKVRDRVAEVDFKQKGDQVLEYIKDNPGKSVLIALAAGFLVGYVTRPRE